MSFRLLNTECFIFSDISDDKGLATMVWFENNFTKWNLRPWSLFYGMVWYVYGVGTILPAHENLDFHFYLANMHELFYQQKIHIHPHYSRLTLALSKSRWNRGEPLLKFNANGIVFSFTEGSNYKNLSKKTFQSILKVSCY